MTEVYALVGVLCASELPWVTLGAGAVVCAAAGALAAWAWHRRRCRRVW